MHGIFACSERFQHESGVCSSFEEVRGASWLAKNKLNTTPEGLIAVRTPSIGHPPKECHPTDPVQRRNEFVASTDYSFDSLSDKLQGGKEMCLEMYRVTIYANRTPAGKLLTAAWDYPIIGAEWFFKELHLKNRCNKLSGEKSRTEASTQTATHDTDDPLTSLTGNPELLSRRRLPQASVIFNLGSTALEPTEPIIPFAQTAFDENGQTGRFGFRNENKAASKVPVQRFGVRKPEELSPQQADASIEQGSYAAHTVPATGALNMDVTSWNPLVESTKAPPAFRHPLSEHKIPDFPPVSHQSAVEHPNVKHVPAQKTDGVAFELYYDPDGNETTYM